MSPPSKRNVLYSLFTLLFSVISLNMASCGDSTRTLTGFVFSGDQAIEAAHVSLYVTGTGQGPRLLGTAQSDGEGSFSMTYKTPSNPEAVLYLFASRTSLDQPSKTQVIGGNTLLLATVLGTDPATSQVVVNERSTVATAFAMAQFFTPLGIDGPSPGLQNAAAIVRNLVNLENGEVANMLGTSPNGPDTMTMPTFNSLANLLALCVNSQAECPPLFGLSATPQGEVPANTLMAAVNIAHFPWQNVPALLNLSQMGSLYSPALPADAALTAWTLALIYEGNKMQFDGPGNIAFDAWGNAWINNNYIFKEGVLDPNGEVCGSDQVFKLSPTGENVDGSPFTGGGLYGAGFGITLDTQGDVWVTNFGFQGTNCPNDIEELSQTVSKFAPDGTPLSPDSQGNQSGQDHGGFQGAGNTLRQPQGIVSDRDGNIWMASCANSGVTQFPGGDPNAAFAIAPVDHMDQPLLENPFDMAIDADGNAWVTSNHNSSVFQFDPAGNLIFSLTGSEATDAGVIFPMGIASDRLGNVWVADAGLPSPPCGASGSPQDFLDNVDITLMPGFNNDNAAITMIAPDGSAMGPFQGGGLLWPWGIAVDGADNIWVANFAGMRLSHFCGPRPETCPHGLNTGDPISPDGGYGNDGLARNTGVQIDPSGNVWLTNNWITVSVQTNPGGRSVVVFIGLATPVKTPLIGPPRI